MNPYRDYMAKLAFYGTSGMVGMQHNPQQGQVQGGQAADVWNSSVGNSEPLQNFSYMASFHSASEPGDTSGAGDNGWEIGKFAASKHTPLKLLAGGAAGVTAVGGGIAVKDHLRHQHEVADARSSYQQRMLEARMLTSPSFRKLPAEEQDAILDAHRNYQSALVDAAGHDPLYSLYR